VAAAWVVDDAGAAVVLTAVLARLHLIGLESLADGEASLETESNVSPTLQPPR